MNFSIISSRCKPHSIGRPCEHIDMLCMGSVYKCVITAKCAPYLYCCIVSSWGFLPIAQKYDAHSPGKITYTLSWRGVIILMLQCRYILPHGSQGDTFYKLPGCTNHECLRGAMYKLVGYCVHCVVFEMRGIALYGEKNTNYGR
jgi:hypothetical protein